MKVRFSLTYINSPTLTRSETIDSSVDVLVPIVKDDTIFMIKDGKEWEGKCTRVHHLMNEDAHTHTPMYCIDLKFIRNAS